MRYAVFDWDNTLRKGFTLFTWMDFLYSMNILEPDVRQKMGTIQKMYADGKISHDEYAELACALYSFEMKGMEKGMRRQLRDRYMVLDRRYIFSFAFSVFGALKKYHIKPIIISGAPDYIIAQYARLFNIYKIFAFSEDYSNGVCTGKVAYNHGMDKGRIIESLCSEYGEAPIIGFGDSSSDLPLFDYSVYPFCVVDDLNSNEFTEKPFGDRVSYISSKATAAQMRLRIENACRYSMNAWEQN